MEPISASYIKDLRKRLGLSQDEFAKEVGTVGRSVTRWENDKSLPRKKAMIRRIRELATTVGMYQEDAPRAEDRIDRLEQENMELKAIIKKMAKKEKARPEKRAAS